MEFRQQMKNALARVLKLEKNQLIIEKHIFNATVRLQKIKIDKEPFQQAYTRLGYEILGDILKKKPLGKIVTALKQNKTDWKHESFTNITHQMEEQDEFLINPFEVSEGVLECRCGSKRVFSYQRQQRGSDEPMTTFAQCMKCSKRWTYSG